MRHNRMVRGPNLAIKSFKKKKKSFKKIPKSGENSKEAIFEEGLAKNFP